MKTQTMDSIGAASAKTSMTAGAVTATFSFMSNEMLFGIIGALFTLLTFIISWYYKRKADARAEAIAQQKAQEHELRMEMLRSQKGHLLFDPVSDMPPEVEIE